MPGSVTPPSPSPSPPLDPVAAIGEGGLAPLPTLKIKGNTPITFDGQLSRTLQYHEDVRTGCGGQTWPAGMVLGKHMLRYHREELQNARILEIGAGGGLVGLGVALECDGMQSRLLLTDQAEMLELMEHNIRLNDVEHRAEALILNWGEALPEQVVQVRPNVIIAAECVYFEPAFPLLLQTLKDLLALNDEAVVYFCFKKRRRADMRFVKMARKAFVVDELADEDRPVFERQGLFLFSLRSRNGRKAGSKAKEESSHTEKHTPHE
ncbi:protein N-lysine methyltransferase METTL21A [Geosmithia morbida]|uniref:Protein-lysine N-methyltransferase EFM6 n=1 Tax=Geosmithia morbida TaxID=1094350 RepID=A0A9P4Z0C6_9HYPO|nr:protein N-lysine methyltransferase METTL21A [Geosmithia morbida]KAF4124319.1 protein N-lysine methyltransferase METTL21A [Geosmithia morbida]